ncbi:MAG TPA: cupredoxin domain-containing protein [Rhodopila sp.]|jgi:plastocyanin|nr:cupredoxin domain-containing protein [Rhodopila sp.]
MRIAACAFIIALAAFYPPRSSVAQRTTEPARATETITVHLSNFAFDPAQLRLKVGVPVRLRLVNESGGGHDFSSPSFFSANTVLPGGSAPEHGEIAVASHQTVEMTLLPRTPGTYRLECTHFLHSFFGMHGTIEVTP